MDKILDTEKLIKIADGIHQFKNQEEERFKIKQQEIFDSKVKAILDEIPKKAKASAKRGHYNCYIMTLREGEDYEGRTQPEIEKKELYLTSLKGVVAEVVKILQEQNLNPYITNSFYASENRTRFNLYIKWK